VRADSKPWPIVVSRRATSSLLISPVISERRVMLSAVALSAFSTAAATSSSGSWIDDIACATPAQPYPDALSARSLASSDAAFSRVIASSNDARAA
jgi:hypothetical protein